MDRVAICIPSFNNEHMIKRLLDSIEKQTYRNFIVVISDDSITSNVQELVKNYNSFRLIYHRNSSSLGPTENTNNAIKMAMVYSPDYIKVMHHDDYFSFEYSLQNLVELLDNHPECDMAFCGTYQVREDDKYNRAITEEQVKLLKQDFRILTIGNYIGAPSAVIVRNKEIFMDENLVWLVDVEWYLRILQINPEFVFTEAPLVSIGVSNTQVTNSCLSDPALMLRENIYIYKKHMFVQNEVFAKKIIYDTDNYLKLCSIIKKCKNFEKVYIYGAGSKGKYYVPFLEKNHIKIQGFVVSDGHKEVEFIGKYPVLELHQMVKSFSSESGILFALNEKNYREVISEMTYIDNNNIIYIR